MCFRSAFGDQINKKIIAPLAKANKQLSSADFPDFNNANKLGSGKEMVDRLTNLIAIFENKALLIQDINFFSSLSGLDN